MKRYSGKKRMSALAMAVLTAAASGIPAAAAPIGSGVTPSYDEAYYATLDYYGNLQEGSVVKSYALNGAASLTDYGVYDEVVNLTDSTPVSLGEGRADFQFSEAPGRFYFEGKTARPFQELPWTVTLRYTLNGVPVQAEELAGKQGVVEIQMDVVPNVNASAYARFNYTLEAMAVFNQDDILSLEAEGAQVQLVGNLRTVLFVALPGEEEHFTIRVGSDDFSFGGMTILMVPATLGQLQEVAKLSQRKDELEEDYRALSGSLDALLDAMEGIQGGLYASASGLDQLNAARGTISGGKGLLYDDAGVLRGDLSAVADLLEPVEERVRVLSETITSSKAALNEMTDTTVSLKDQLGSLEKSLKELEKGTKEVKYFMQDAADLENSLHKLEKALNNTKAPSIGSDGQLAKVIAVHAAYKEKDQQAFMEKMLVLQGKSAEEIAGIKQLLGLTQEQADAAGMLTQWQAAQGAAQQMDTLFNAKDQMTFQAFCGQLPGVTPEQAAQMDQLWQVYSEIDSIQGDLSSTLNAVTRPTANVVGELAGLCEQLDDLADYLDGAKDLTAALGQTSGKMSAILDSVDSLRNTLNGYEPTLQEGLTNLGGLSNTAAGTLRDMETLMSDMEELMKNSGRQLDAGSKQTLSGLSASLRQIAAALEAAEDVRDAKSAVNGIVEDTWHEYTGDVNNLLMMDAGAQAVSLTDPRNPAPSSVQILIRTQEIKADGEGGAAPAAQPLSARTAPSGEPATFWGRVAQMFKDFWKALTGIFR